MKKMMTAKILRRKGIPQRRLWSLQFFSRSLEASTIPKWINEGSDYWNQLQFANDILFIIDNITDAIKMDEKVKRVDSTNVFRCRYPLSIYETSN